MRRLVLTTGLSFVAAIGCATLMSSPAAGPSELALSASSALALQSQATSRSEVVDEYDRNGRLWRYQRLAKSGWQRGMDLFQMKCWVCHNEYTITEERDAGGAPAPSLLGLYKRVNDEQVAKQVAAFIRNGSLRMPAFTTATLSEQDMADLLAYMRQCGAMPRWCFDGTPAGAEHNPSPNPWFRAGP